MPSTFNPTPHEIMSEEKCVVEKTTRSVIEHKLLTALNDENKVAILATEQDLKDLHAALCGYARGERKGEILTWEAWMKRCKSLAQDIQQLLDEAFPK